MNFVTTLLFEMQQCNKQILGDTSSKSFLVFCGTCDGNSIGADFLLASQGSSDMTGQIITTFSAE